MAQSKYSSKKQYPTKSNSNVKLMPNETRLNIASSIYGVPEINYERYFTDNMGAGLAASFTLLSTADENQRYCILPYSRIYFGEKSASGFFFEANAAIIGRKRDTASYYLLETGPKYYTTTNIGFGAAIGVKLVAKNGIIGEVFAGGGRRFGEDSDAGGYLRIGVSIGMRYK